jgi:hypothetical protein
MHNIQTPLPESTSELCRPSVRRLSTKLVSTFADRGCRVVRVIDPYGRILDFLDRSHYFFFQIAPQLCSRGWMDPVPDPLHRKSGSIGSRTRDLWICSLKSSSLDLRGGLHNIQLLCYPIYPRSSLGCRDHIPLRVEGFFMIERGPLS